MARVTFEFDPEFDENVYRASNKQGSSLRGLYDMVRKVTDSIASDARGSITGEWIRAEAEAQGLRDNRTHGDKQKDWLHAKANSFALRSALQSTVPSMGFDGREIYGMVSINRRGSVSLEFGGPDPVAEVGKGTGVYVNHPPFAFLRRAMDRAG